MGYGIYIKDPQTGETINIDEKHHIIGSIYQVGGSTELYLSITYNYSPFYYRKETLGESTKIYGEKPVDGALPVLQEEAGGIPGLQYLTIPEARLKVMQAINNLRDEPLDKDGKPYKPVECFDGDKLQAGSYWAPTEANARRALMNLLQLLLLAPENAKIEVC